MEQYSPWVCMVKDRGLTSSNMLGCSLVMGRKSGSRPRDGVGQPGRLTKNPGNRKMQERN